MKRLLVLALFGLAAYLLVGCGYKYPMPPISEGGLPPESSYVHVATWDIPDPVDLEVGRDNLVYVISNGQVLKCYGNGQPQEDFYTAGLVDPVSVSQAPDWSIVVADSGDGSIKFYDLDGNLIRTIRDSFLAGVTGAVMDEDYRIFAVFGAKDLILLIDTAGALIDTVAHYGNGIRDVENPGGIDLEGDLLGVASTGHNWVELLSIYEPYENMLHLGGETHDGDTLPGYFLEPLDVSIDANGFVYVADNGNLRIQKFSPSGEFIISAFSKDVDSGFSPVKISVSQSGENLYGIFTDGVTRRIEKFQKAIPPGGGGGE